MKRWTLDFSTFHASIESVVGWAHIPFLPLYYRDVEVLQDLAFILGIPFRIDEASLIANPRMFVRVCLELDLTHTLKRCLVIGDENFEIRSFISYEALFEICFYCGHKKNKDEVHICPIKGTNKNFLKVERLANEPTIFPTNMVVDEEFQSEMAEDIIMVFPPPTIVTGGESDAPSVNQEGESDPEWTVVTNRKGKGKGSMRNGRSFREVARGV